MKYARSDYLLAFVVGSLIAWKALPQEWKNAIPHLDIIEVATSCLLGGLYSVEKLKQIPASVNGIDTNTGKVTNA